MPSCLRPAGAPFPHPAAASSHDTAVACWLCGTQAGRATQDASILAGCAGWLCSSLCALLTRLPVPPRCRAVPPMPLGPCRTR